MKVIFLDYDGIEEDEKFWEEVDLEYEKAESFKLIGD